jgi:hypothetical protein
MSEPARRSPASDPAREPREPRERREPRPIIERIGLAAVAALLAILFGGVAAASWIGGEPFLTVMGGVGCLMTVWVGLITLVRG